MLFWPLSTLGTLVRPGCCPAIACRTSVPAQRSASARRFQGGVTAQPRPATRHSCQPTPGRSISDRCPSSPRPQACRLGDAISSPYEPDQLLPFDKNERASGFWLAAGCFECPQLGPRRREAADWQSLQYTTFHDRLSGSANGHLVLGLFDRRMPENRASLTSLIGGASH
jgi:hypothetical protein